MTESVKANLTRGNETRLLIKLTIPMVFGMLSMVFYNLVDTFYVGQLGKDQLAALSFTFPVVMVIGSIALGIGIGTSSLVSRALGQRDEIKTRRYATDSLILGFLLVMVVIVLGLFTLRPLFTLLGARGVILDHVEEYMRIWYPGMVFVVIPMIANNTLRATGDSKNPGLIMVAGAVTNFILDPFLIFGIAFFPRLEIRGAALATVFARLITFGLSLSIVTRKKLLSFRIRRLSVLLESWKEILYIGIPNALIKSLIPLGMGVITGLIARFGPGAVAAYGVVSRIEFFALATVNALSSITGPFVGQNWGARRYSRVIKGYHAGEKLALGIGAFFAVFLFLFSRPVAALFSSHPAIIDYIALFLKIAPFAYCFQGLMLITGAALNAINRPYHATSLVLMEMFVLYIPLSLLLSQWLQATGIFIALAVAYSFTGGMAHLMFHRTFRRSHPR